MTIKLIGPVLFVKDIKVSRDFYEGLLEQTVELDFGVNVGFCGGFAIWQKEHALSIMKVSNSECSANEPSPCFELCLEADNLDGILTRLSDNQVKFVHEMYEQPWGQRAIRVFDPDGHIVEIGEPMTTVIERYLSSGMKPDEVVALTGMPIDLVLAQVGSQA